MNNTYTPLEKPVTGKGSTGTKLRSADDRFRDEIILTTVAAWVQRDPQEAVDFIQSTKALKGGQLKSTGALKGKNRANAYVKYRLPQGLLDCIRVALDWAERTYEMEFEVFGVDDKDMKLLVQKFPDLFRYAHNCTWGK
jgi:hypothetical protein